MGICRTRFKKDIVTEFVAPKNRKSGKVILFCAGVPGVPHKDEVLEFWASKGYWAFFPRYRGTWESGGSFLEKSPEQDVLDVISSFRTRFKDYWSGEYFSLSSKHITVVGSSFGGPAALLASRDARVDKVLCLSPVVDWQAEDRSDPLKHLYEILRDGYGSAYRVLKKDWNKLSKGKFYNPVKHLDEYDAEKIMIFHAKDDEVVRYRPVERFAKKVGCRLILFKRGGHLSSSLLMSAKQQKKIKTFIKPRTSK